MERSTNALAELAERLDKIVFGLITDGHPCDETIDIRKAKRIVEELAKVEDNMLNTSCTVAMLLRCRAIAEEGAGDGK